MANLPPSILTVIFRNLNSIDIKQCQLTNKMWSTTATEVLYESVKIRTTAAARSLITILPKYGHHINFLNVDKLLNTADLKTKHFWDPLDLFTHISTHCPNLFNIQTSSKVFHIIYARLIHCRYNDQLQHLGSIPYPPTSGSIESYAYTAIAYQTTLKKLLLCDQLRATRCVDTIEKKTYKRLEGELKNFRVLRKLKVIRHVKQSSFVAYDALLRECPQLESLQLNIYQDYKYPPISEPVSEHEPLKSNVKALKMNWDLLYDDRALICMMGTFTTLDSLHVYSCADILTVETFYNRPKLVFNTTQQFNFSALVLLDFLTYLLKIPKVNVELTLSNDNFTTLLQQLMTVHKDDVVFEIQYKKDPFAENRQVQRPNLKLVRSPSNSKIVLTVMYQIIKPGFDSKEVDSNEKKEIDIAKKVFEIDAENHIMPHMGLTAPVNHHIKRMKIVGFNYLQKGIARSKDRATYYDMINGIWLQHLLHYFSSLQSLEIHNPGRINLSKQDPVLKNTSLEALKMTFSKRPTCRNTFGTVSIHLPSLRHFDIHMPLLKDKFNVVDMYYTAFETLVWCDSTFRTTDNLVIHIKAATTITRNIFYYITDDSGKMYRCGPCSYPNPLKKDAEARPNAQILSFDIKCKELKVFKVVLADGVERYYEMGLWLDRSLLDEDN